LTGTDRAVNFSLVADSASVAYYVVELGGTNPPVAATLLASGTAVALTPGQAQTISVGSLTAATTYSVHVMVRDTARGINSTVRSLGLISGGGRNALVWPFSSQSIWNMPIGTGAVYVPANLPAVPGPGGALSQAAPMPGLEIEQIVLTPTAPLTPIYQNTTAWTIGGDRCFASATTTTTVLATVPMPTDFLIPNTRQNNATVFLDVDGRTLIHTQPVGRCGSGQPATALLVFAPREDLYGTGITGSHGGSGLSALGGTLRLGELRPGGSPPRHALKIDVDTREVFPPCPVRANCFRWPAIGPDSDATTSYGSMAIPGVSPAMRMGALLALPASLNINAIGLETDAAKQLAWTLQNYGAYIVDSTGFPAYLIAVENSPNGSFADQFRSDWGFDFNQRVSFNTAWTRDWQKLFAALNVVDNNTPTTIGGGGTPLQPLAPSFALNSPFKPKPKAVSRAAALPAVAPPRAAPAAALPGSSKPR
jgi:hypothetical protein